MANGAEPVSPDTLERFLARFGRYGLERGALAPVYGLAESTVGLLCPPMGRGPLIDCIRREHFMAHREALPASDNDPNPLRFVACGRPLPGHEVRVVDDAGVEVGERVEGRLEFKGPSATSGYYRNSEESERLFDDGWLDTGDRAYMAEGDVYVTGRVKDIIIRGGRNIYPHELEEAVGMLPGVRKGCVAAFGSRDPRTGTERLIVLAETRLTEAQERKSLRETIYRTTIDILGEPPDEVVLAPPHTVLKTSSGKIRRAASRELYEAGLIGSRAPAVWRSLIGLGGRYILVWVRRRTARAGSMLYRAYVWTLFWLFAPVVWCTTALMPRPRWAWAVGRTAARLFLKLSGCPLVVRGAENLPRNGASVLVANHASYIDGLVLMAAVPSHFGFVAKRELGERFVSRIFLRRLGAEFVERFDARQSVEDANRLAVAASRGKSLAFFPEGTFTDLPGLLPFHLGAFVVAARARVPILPVAIRGSRTLLRGNRWIPKRGVVVVTVGEPIVPCEENVDTFAAATELRDAARKIIARACGETDLGPVAVNKRAPSAGG
jgi:1-acyl-sn-glycerol-3-phosphate acyltransferase